MNLRPFIDVYFDVSIGGNWGLQLHLQIVGAPVARLHVIKLAMTVARKGNIPTILPSTVAEHEICVTG